MTERATGQHNDHITVMADYFSISNEIIQPDQYVSTSRYFCLKWEPSLGLVGARIVRVLRALGYYNRQTGEMRDGIPIDLPELAVLCGFSVATIKREFGSGKDGKAANPHLHTFVQREKNYKHDAVTGQVWREENIYRVKMDDPVHPDDLLRLQELWEARQKGGSPSKSAANTRKDQFAPYGAVDRKAHSEPYGKTRRAHLDSKSSQDESNPSQLAPRSNQDESNSVQNEPALIDYLSSPKPLETSSSYASPEFLTSSLFQEEDKPGPRKSQQEATGDALDALLAEEWTALEAAARARVIAESADPVRRLAREGKAWTSVRSMMRKLLGSGWSPPGTECQEEAQQEKEQEKQASK